MTTAMNNRLPKIILAATAALAFTLALALGLQSETARRVGRGLCFAAAETKSIVARSAARELPMLNMVISSASYEKECS